MPNGKVTSDVTLNVSLDVSQLLNVDRYQKQNQPLLLRTAVQRYHKWLRNRYISLAAGSGRWPKLQLSTIQRKKRRAKKEAGITGKPHWILREYNVLLRALNYTVRNKQWLVGFTKNVRHPRGRTVFQLVRIHSKGVGGLPVRRIIDLPTNSVRKQMLEDIKKEYNKELRKRRK